MKIHSEDARVICSNPNSIHNYFAWPTVARLRDGKLAMVASGFRLTHVCPFGKGIISYSEDNGNTWTLPAVIIDTPLDDRDCGITPFGESSVIVTSFNNSIAFQRKDTTLPHRSVNAAYSNSYLDQIEKDPDAEKLLNGTFRISNDNGITWGDIHTIPITSPHGPCELPDGSLLWVGSNRLYRTADPSWTGGIDCYRIFPDGKYEYVCSIETEDTILYGEPYAAILKNGKIIVHIRVDSYKNTEIEKTFTIYQCETDDLSKGFSKPHPILSRRGGAPSHILELSNGMLIATYSYRGPDLPYGIRVMFSKDGGETWDTDNILYENSVTEDLGYPSSVELPDGRILTTFYAHKDEASPAEIMQIVWSYEQE